MNKKIMKTFLIFTLSLFFLTITACQHYGEHRHLRHGTSEGLTNYIVNKLDLDPGQEASLEEVLKNLEEGKEGLVRKDEFRNIFVKQFRSNNFDEEYELFLRDYCRRDGLSPIKYYSYLFTALEPSVQTVRKYNFLCIEAKDM